jgi:monoterpene epsilon-lactone hydrolase
MSRTKPSLRARFAASLFRILFKRPLLNEREIVEFGRRAFGGSVFIPTAPPPDVATSTSEVGGVPGEWVIPREGATATLLYVHGGGYFACSPRTHRPITTWLARSIPAKTFAPDYRLAPEHRFPAALDDILAAYRGLVHGGVDPSTLLMAGDSAGGGLALAACVALRDRGEQLPAALALFSPWTDLAMTGASIETNRDNDAMFHCDFLVPASRIYLGGTDPRHPLASPLYADMTGLPIMHVQVGRNEAMYDDAARLVDKARRAGVEAHLDEWEGVPHGWQILNATIPEARESLDTAASWLRSALAGSRQPVAA